MSVNVVRRAFKTFGKLYTPGTIITDPAGIKLYKSKVREKKIIEVDEHNLDETILYLKQRRGVDVADELTEAVRGKKKELSFEEKVALAAEKYGIATEGRELDEVVADVKAAQEAAKKDK